MGKFFADINTIKATMKKDRAHHERQLTKSTDALYKTLADNQEAQNAVNKKLTAATRRTELDAQQALKEAKEGFASKIGALTTTVNDNEKKVNKKVLELTGVVQKNAIKDAKGRANLSKISKWNKSQAKNAIRDAIAAGEKRALQVESKMKGINAANRKELNTRITTEISTLRKQIHGQVLDLELSTKEARAEMKKQLMFAIDTEAKLAAENLKKAVAWSEGEFSKLNTNLANEKTLSGAGRANLKRSIDTEKKVAVDLLNNAVAAQNKALLAYKNEMCNELGSADIKGCPKESRGSINKRLDGEAKRMEANAKQVKAEMKAQTAAINESLENARKAAQAELAATSVSSVKRYNAVIKAVEDGVSAAREAADKKFSDVQITMAKDRRNADKNLAGAVTKLNDSIAKASALEEQRFKKTVKDLGAARKAAADDVTDAKKEMLMGLSKVQANAKAVESRIIGQIEAVAATILSDKAEQGRINNKVDGEMSRILKLSDSNQVEDKRARGVIRKVMEENKRIAHEEVVALGKEARLTLKAVNSEQNSYLAGFKKDLTSSTKKVYAKMAKDAKAQNQANAALTTSLSGAKKQFNSRYMSLTNAVVANQKSYKRKMDKATGVVNDWKKASTTDRKLIREERGIMETKLRASIVRAIQIGEAKMKAVEERAMENIATEKKTLMTTISVAVENMADNVFATVQGDRQKIADNFLSLKAYAAAAADKVIDYVQKGKGKNLSSIGDLLQTLAATFKVKAVPAVGDGFGAETA